ncbi:MAG: AmmeMemoRadiSam system protein B [Sulfolobales archaeon]|nr:AmmeMemoRadiSam system protein B [Sulfolobales archaeon]MCX8186802.1 AmmeMemoRadiSam system protein B [Sulfolobales archaeon]MDW7969865.1 AmmeMemoRadiSam system protein B [Sulfolobales archaeon]
MGVLKRTPVVAGSFYESSQAKLIDRIKWCFIHELGPRNLPEVGARRRESHGYVVPHAGYMYSGPVAAHTYFRVAVEGKPEAFVLLGPNHTGIGTAVSIYDRGLWSTPLGDVEVDSDLAQEILRNSNYVDVNYDAHKYEHSIEVQLPFLQFIFKNFKIVPIVIAYQVPEIAKDLARSIANASNKLGRDVVVLASSDMSHYEPQTTAYEKDREVLEHIVKLSPEDVFDVVNERNVSMCGVGPVMALLYYARSMGGSRGEVLKYATSGDITGDLDAVVGYASVRIF